MFFYPIMYCKSKNPKLWSRDKWRSFNVVPFELDNQHFLLQNSKRSVIKTTALSQQCIRCSYSTCAFAFLFLNVLNNEFFGQYLPYFSSSCHALCTQGLNFLAKSSFYCCKGQKRNCCDGTKMIIGWSTKVRLSGVSMWATSLLYKLHKFLWFYTNVIQIWSRILCNTIDVRLAYQSLKPVWMDSTIFKLCYVILVGRTQRLNVWQSSSILFCCLFFNV